jgi:transposase-like protein/predicted RNA-binding Zn-ribbon protein involved in translation (DUF1610 family)
MKLIDVTEQFGSDEQCLTYLEGMRWPEGVRCPTCGNDKISTITRQSKTKNKRGKLYQCLEATCKQQFSATSGTIFHDSHLPLVKWFMAVALIVDAKKGMSAKQLQQHLGIGSYRTAWYMAHRIRKAMETGKFPLLSGTVEVDETYVGGRQKGKGVYYGKKQKQTVMGAIERGGEIRFAHVPDAKSATIRGFVTAHISPEAEKIITDTFVSYPYALHPEYKGKHETVNHIAGEYVRGEVYTNSIESAFSLLKRGIIGSFHKVSIKHLHRYLSEFEYRFNRRAIDDRFEETLYRLTQGEAMPYRKLISKS